MFIFTPNMAYEWHICDPGKAQLVSSQENSPLLLNME